MVKPARVADIREVIYGEKRWKILGELRKRALELMLPLEASGFKPIVHGSAARGDVDKNSDVDVFIPYVVPSFKLELALLKVGLAPIKREIVMATPWQLPKAQLYIEDDRSVAFPLVKPRQSELEFYYFGGAAGVDELKREVRVPGVDKRLMLIQPTEKGHLESPVMGNEGTVAKALGVGLEIVRERVQVLTRRAKVGHTGIFIRRELAPKESFEEVFQQLVRENPDMKIGLKERLP
ncbi:MAG: nucleotidyltransferase domain-containing protein [Candidatus Hadarchaeum sp.]|uniref:nucleotidyltransferase domain-containing protein n=1 Tax=Candidatus Hadarchaeum sp. TaxID=2883567 RepID=UPI003D09F8A1